jgi:acetyl esterase/lipase
MDSTIVYAKRGDRELRLDVYEARGAVNHHTAILVLHGGGWRIGDKTMVASRCELLAKLGFTALGVEYRLLDASSWPAPLQDVKSAVAWVHAHAGELGVDADKVVLQGHSAGAQLALLAAGTPGMVELGPDDEPGTDARVAAVAAFYPPVRLTVGGQMPDVTSGPPSAEAMRKAMLREDGTSPMAEMIFGPDATEDDARAASPMTYVSEDFPPTILFHGSADIVVHEAASRSLYEKLKSFGVPTEMHLVADANHEFDATPSLGEVAAVEVGLFVRRFVSKPEALEDEIQRTNPIAVMTARDTVS